MPNHVINILSFEGDKTKIRQMLEDIKDDECGLHSVDFNKIIPMPPGLDLEAGSCTQAGLDASLPSAGAVVLVVEVATLGNRFVVGMKQIQLADDPCGCEIVCVCHIIKQLHVGIVADGE